MIDGFSINGAASARRRSHFQVPPTNRRMSGHGIRIAVLFAAATKRTPRVKERLHVVRAARCRCGSLRNGRARRLTLRIDSGGRGLRVTVPPGVAWREVDRFLSRHQDWLEQRLAKVPVRPNVRPGIKLPLRGVPHRIVHEPGTRGTVTVGQQDRRAGAHRPWRAPASVAPAVRFPEAPGQARHRGAGREAHADDPQARQGGPLPRHGQPLGLLHVGRERCPFPGAS